MSDDPVQDRLPHQRFGPLREDRIGRLCPRGWARPAGVVLRLRMPELQSLNAANLADEFKVAAPEETPSVV